MSLGDVGRRPLVLVTTWRRRLPTFLSASTDLYTLGSEYVDSIRTSHGVPLLLPQIDPEGVDQVLDAVDAVVVSGGGDVDPSSYGAPSEHVQDNDPAADTVELAILTGARARQIPTLAICRGMQLLNVAYGGDLMQQVTSVGTPHPPVVGDPDDLLRRRHWIDIEADSRLASILGPGQREVNAIHHQAVGRVGDGISVAARAVDGIIEAIEPDDWPDCIGVQWHPEKLAGADRNLFDWLILAASGKRS
ncbi:MAG: gamma-glutamyl-gamma-aminobutyrate hydrolase family protein [Acidimicrobiia bacterium]